MEENSCGQFCQGDRDRDQEEGTQGSRAKKQGGHEGMEGAGST